MHSHGWIRRLPCIALRLQHQAVPCEPRTAYPARLLTEDLDMKQVRFEIYNDKSGRSQPWRWRLVAANGEPVASGGEGFVSRPTPRGRSAA